MDRLTRVARSEVDPDLPKVLGGRRVVVTGAASGIGRAVAAACRQAGADVIAVDLNESEGIARCDVRSEDDVCRLFQSAEPCPTDVIHCAGIASTEPIEDVSLDLWHSIIETNLTGSFLVGREFVRSLEGPGSLTFIASAGGLRGGAYYTAYGASKFGVVGLMKCMALELAPRRVRVNAVCPGGVRTPMVVRTVAQDAARTGIAAEVLRRGEDEVVPLGRMAEPEEVANVCVFLASDLARHVAGAALLVDGAQNV